MLLEIGNRWIVPNNFLLSHALKVHINVEFVTSVNSLSISANDASRKGTGGPPQELAAKWLKNNYY